MENDWHSKGYRCINDLFVCFWPCRELVSVRICSGVRHLQALRPMCCCPDCSWAQIRHMNDERINSQHSPDKCGLLEDHVVVGVVEGIASHHPHQSRMHQSSMGCPTQRLSWWLDAGKYPEGLSGGDSESAVWTWHGQSKSFIVQIYNVGPRGMKIRSQKGEETKGNRQFIFLL